MITQPRQLFVSLHIPKTGGTSLHQLLSRRFGQGFNTAYGALAADSAKVRNDRYPITCIHGHNIVNQYQELLAEIQNQYWITFLREPLEGAISLYYFTRKSLNKNPDKPMFEDRGLDAWLLNTEKARWPFPHGYPNNRYSRAIKRADKTIDQFDFVGITERFDESMQCMCDIFDWVHMPSESKNQGVYTAPDIDQSVLASFLANNSEDYVLYELATKKLNSALATMGL